MPTQDPKGPKTSRLHSPLSPHHCHLGHQHRLAEDATQMPSQQTFVKALQEEQEGWHELKKQRLHLKSSLQRHLQGLKYKDKMACTLEPSEHTQHLVLHASQAGANKHEPPTTQHSLLFHFGLKRSFQNTSLVISYVVPVHKTLLYLRHSPNMSSLTYLREATFSHPTLPLTDSEAALSSHLPNSRPMLPPQLRHWPYQHHDHNMSMSYDVT